MSILSEISRITTLRNNIRNKLIALGILNNANASLSDCYTGINGIVAKSADTITPTRSAQTAVPSGRYTTGVITVDGIPASYVDVSDSTVDSAHLLTGYTAYDSSGTKIYGNYVDGGGGDYNIISSANPDGSQSLAITDANAIQTQSKTLTLGASTPQMVTPDQGYLLSSVPVEIDTNAIKAEYIAEGESILGITGTHSGGGGTCTLTILDTVYQYDNDPLIAFVEKNGTVSPTGDVPPGQYTLAKDSVVVVSDVFSQGYQFEGNATFKRGIGNCRLFFISGDATVYFSCVICCFSEDVMILMADGTAKKIKDVIKGDIVKSYNNQTKSLEDTEVINTVKNRRATNMARITLIDGSVLEFNAYHPFMTQDGYKSLTEFDGMPLLTINDKLLSYDGGFVEIKNIEQYTVSESPVLYNIHTMNNNYFVQNNGASVLAHDGRKKEMDI